MNQEQTPWYEQVVIPALLRHARAAYGGAMRQALAEAGFDDLPANGLYVVGALALGDSELPLSDIIRELRLSKQAAGQLVDTLVLRGYLERAVDADDRRKLVVSLTERGRAAAQVQGEARDAVDARLMERVGADTVVAARRALGALCEIAREQREASA